jgi:hypothetical protein
VNGSSDVVRSVRRWLFRVIHDEDTYRVSSTPKRKPQLFAHRRHELGMNITFQWWHGAIVGRPELQTEIVSTGELTMA